MKAFHEKNIYPDGFSVDIVKFNSFSFLPHWHNDIEIVHVYEGCLRMTVNSVTRVLSAGESCICCSGDIHSYDSDDLKCTGILVFFGTEIVGPQIKWPQDAVLLTAFIDEVTQETFHMSPDFSKKIGETLNDVYEELASRKNQYQDIVRGKLLTLQGLILRNVPTVPNNTGHLKSYSMLDKIQNALDYINVNYMEELTFSEVAIQAELKSSQFAKLFNHMCGMSFVTYLNHLRVSKAEEMMITTTESITDIALECGFNSIRNFNRLFKEENGMSPSRFRKSHQ